MARDAAACEIERARLYALLTAHVEDHALAGRDAILDYLHDLGLRDLGGRAITWTRVYRWTQKHRFPLLPGVPGRRRRYAALTSKIAVQAWILSRPHNGCRGLFAVWPSTARSKNARRASGENTAPSAPLAAAPHER